MAKTIVLEPLITTGYKRHAILVLEGVRAFVPGFDEFFSMDHPTPTTWRVLFRRDETMSMEEFYNAGFVSYALGYLDALKTHCNL